MMSTGGSFAPSSLVISPTWSRSGNRCFVTSMGNGSISLAHTGVMPWRFLHAYLCFPLLLFPYPITFSLPQYGHFTFTVAIAHTFLILL